MVWFESVGCEYGVATPGAQASEDKATAAGKAPKSGKQQKLDRGSFITTKFTKSTTATMSIVPLICFRAGYCDVDTASYP